MESLVNKNDIQTYAKRNTSPKMGIEELYLQAFIDSILNSTELKEKFKVLSDEMQNGDSFVIFGSYDVTARNLNKEPYRSILAYSMLKKDIRLFELISASLFTGSVEEYHGSDLYNDIVKNTDEVPIKYTDSGIYTDMGEGNIIIGFKNIFTTEYLEDGTGTEYQLLEELQKSLEDFDYLITLTKPARVIIILFNEPYCFVGGTRDEVKTINVDFDFEQASCPIGDRDSMDILDNMTDLEVMDLYRIITYYEYDSQTGAKIQKEIHTKRYVIREEGYIQFTYEFRINSHYVEGKFIWDIISIQSALSLKAYIRSLAYDTEDEGQYFEKYIPILLRINDDDPDGPCLALRIENNVPVSGAMFYIREKITD